MLETVKDASSSGLSMQKASKSELDSMVQKQQSARPKLSGDVQLSMQPHSSKWVLQDPDLGINTPTGQHPKNSRDTMVSWSYR